MGRAILVSVGLALGVACQIPSTLGLVCKTDAHCDSGQSCIDDVCTVGSPAADTGSDTTGTVPDPTTSSSGDGSSTAAVDPDGTSSGSSTGVLAETGSSSTGLACGVESCRDLDLLVLLDNSDSMFQWIVPLANSLPGIISLVSEEVEKVCTYRLALASGNEMPEDNPKNCQFPGALLHRPKKCGGGDGVRPWWDETDGTPAQVLDQLRCLIIDQGTGGSSMEFMLDSLLGTLDPANNEAGGCNEEFRRPDANLVILYISDEDDPTPLDEIDTYAENFQMFVDPNLVGFVSVVADDAKECPWEPEPDNDDGMGAEVPSRLNGFLALSGIPFDQRSAVDICEDNLYDFDQAFDVFEATCGR